MITNKKQQQFQIPKGNSHRTRTRTRIETRKDQEQGQAITTTPTGEGEMLGLRRKSAVTRSKVGRRSDIF